jgi:hypothetical protein
MAGSNDLALAAAAGQITITRAQRDKALRLIRKHGRAIGDLKALSRAGVLGTRGQLRHLLATDETLKDEIVAARGRDPEVIRDEIRRRAIEGVEEPVFGSLGQNMGSGEIGSKRVYSDRLLEMMAKAHLPEYQDSVRHEHTGPAGGPLEVSNPDVAAALDRFTSTIARLSERAAESGGDVREAEPERAALPPGRPGG